MTDVTTIKRELGDLQDQITEGKKKRDQLEGKIESQMERLKDDFKVSSLAEAKKLKDTKIVSREKLEKTIISKYEGLRKEFDW